MTTLYYTLFEDKISDDLFHEILDFLPADFSDKARKFWRWQDAHASLFGKLLLLDGFRNFGISDSLSDLKFTKFGKPHLLDNLVSFNISHSGNCVVCIMSDEVETIGVDVEEIRPVNMKGLRNFWSDPEWNDIIHAGPTLFFQYWTRKEAVLKADGRGLGLPLREIDARGTEVECRGRRYFLGSSNFNLNPNYIIHYASLKDLSDNSSSVLQARYMPTGQLCGNFRSMKTLSVG